MNVRFLSLLLMCAAPWLYVGFILLLVAPGRPFTGLVTLPLFVLIWMKDQALMRKEERDRFANKDEPFWKMPLYIVGSLVAVGIIVFLLTAEGALRRYFGEAPITVAGYLMLTSLFAWDVKRAYARTRRSA